MKTENKHSYFIVDLPILKRQQDLKYMEKLEKAIDLILTGMSSIEKPDQFFKTDGSRLQIFFKTKIRKRRGQLVQLCQINFENDQKYETKGVCKTFFYNEIERLNKNEEYTRIDSVWKKQNIMNNYKALDLQLFNDKNQWYPWQQKIYNLIFEVDGRIKELKSTNVICLIDPVRNSGKSSFLKWILYNHEKEMERIRYTSHESGPGLILTVANSAAKKIYWIDLPRANYEPRDEKEFVDTIHELKKGVVSVPSVNPSDSKKKKVVSDSSVKPLVSALTNPCHSHIIISSNYKFKFTDELISKENWQIYKLTKDKTLEKLELKSVVREEPVLQN